MIFRDGVIYGGIMTQNEVRERLGLVPIVEETKRITNCKNCGAPLTKNNYCEYCRTQY